MYPVHSHTFGHCVPQILHYYLVDDTVEIREIHEPNDGRDPYPVLLCRQKLPKDRNDLPCECQQLSSCTHREREREYIGVCIVCVQRAFRPE